jgi:hypothetical protein
MSDTDSKWKHITVIAIGLVVGGMLAGGFYVWAQIKQSATKAQAVGLQRAVQAYIVEYGIAPQGDAAAVTAALQGGNARHIAFFHAPPSQLNGKGEYLDRWGEPFRFDLSDSQNLRIWSPGRNHRDENGTDGSDDVR